ncbi:DoxX family protein [Sphingobacteriales bacterium UPWRP_1]|nr:hypothetical protein BVG80_00665 [Sphingobacteriales bacterium TSM_CSM]PSJ72218.1 DoxX family protein [Sphingobacteriales bacterium UPWRP_1]
MTIYKVFAITAVIALVITAVTAFIKRPAGVAGIVASFIRYFLGVFFIFSGVVKAVDPLGTAFKMEEYFTVFGEYVPALSGFWDFWAHLALPVSVFMIVLEIILGIALILGAMPKLTLVLYAAIIAFFTFLTGFSAITDKVTDCGCFGDFLKLKPITSFYKDLVLSGLVIVLFFLYKHIGLLFNKRLAFISLAVLLFASLGFTMSNYYNLPVVNFRAYKVGTDLMKGKSTEGLDEGEIQTWYTLVNKATNETKEMESKTYTSSGVWRDSTWTIDKSKTRQVVIREPEMPKIKDFIVNDRNEQDVADSLLSIQGYHFFVTSYNLDKASPDGFKKINELLRQAANENITASAIISGNLDSAEQLGEGLFKAYTLDATPIKTWMRSNPGLTLMQGSTIRGLYHYNHLPTWEELKKQMK